jgi:hypothetical protein
MIKAFHSPLPHLAVPADEHAHVPCSCNLDHRTKHALPTLKEEEDKIQ